MQNSNVARIAIHNGCRSSLGDSCAQTPSALSNVRRLVSLVVILAFVLAGCSRVVYRNPNYTPQLWARDSYECERDARQSGYFGTGLVGQLNMRDFFDRCLAVRGWAKTYE